MGAADEKLLFLALSTVLNRVIRNLFAKLTLPLHGLTSLRTNCFISQKCHFMASLVIHTDESRATSSLHLPCIVSTPNFIHTLYQCNGVENVNIKGSWQKWDVMSDSVNVGAKIWKNGFMEDLLRANKKEFTFKWCCTAEMDALKFWVDIEKAKTRKNWS